MATHEVEEFGTDDWATLLKYNWVSLLMIFAPVLTAMSWIVPLVLAVLVGLFCTKPCRRGAAEAPEERVYERHRSSSRGRSTSRY